MKAFGGHLTLRSRIGGLWRGVGVSAAAVIFAAGAMALSASPTAAGWLGTSLLGVVDGKDNSGKDSIVFKDGRTIYGTIVSETGTKVKFKGEVNGIPFETEYDKSEILKVTKGTGPKVDPAAKKGVGRPDAVAADPASSSDTKAPAKEAGEAANRVYLMELTGTFGRDISQTPMRDALKDAKKRGANIIIVKINNKWEENQFEQLGDDASSVFELFRAEDIGPVIAREVQLWETPPRVVVWVQKAMGGAAFLPFYAKEIYFTSEGRMGGIGYLKQVLEGRGDKVVLEKWGSAQLAHARGIADEGGYHPDIISAMVVTEFVLSVKFDPEPTYFQRMPEGPDEVLLTDDGKDANEDTSKAVVAGEGNDVLTLYPKLARDLRVSKGTVDTLEDLLAEMGITRDWTLIDGRAKSIMSKWSEDFTEAVRDLRRTLPRKLAEIQVGGTFQERARARGQMKRIYQQMQDIYRKFKEIFGEENAEGAIAELQRQIDAIDLEQQRDAQENRRR